MVVAENKRGTRIDTKEIGGGGGWEEKLFEKDQKSKLEKQHYSLNNSLNNKGKNSEKGCL